MPDFEIPNMNFDLGDAGELPTMSFDLPSPAENKPEDTRTFDSIEQEAAVRLTELEQAFRDRRDKQEVLQRLQGDTEYWVAFCFQSRAQKEAFLTAAGLIADGDKYLDGVKAAKTLGIAIPDAIEPRIFKPARVDKRYASLTETNNRA